jgi:transglutaminase-like putative cysteine protease
MPSAATPAEEWSDEASIYAELIATEAAPVNRLPWWQVVRQVLPPDKADAQALLEQKAAEILTKSKVPTLDKAREDRLSPGERRQLAINRAKALERYLALSDEYSYALDHRRKDDKLDPTVDFLCNVKEGHCELFASALALMLRSQGIPARVVIGFRGADWNEVGEWHEVRQYNAHAWVEAFIETEPPPSTVRNTPVRNVAELRNKLPRGRWLTLDPSPAGGTAGATAATGTGTLRDLLSFIQFLWEFFVLDYTGDVQRERLMLRFKELRLDETQRFWADLVRSLPRGLIVVVGVAGAFTVGSVVFWLLRARWRKRHAAFYALASRFPFYARFLKLAQRLGAYVGPAQTAAELGEAVRSLVSQRPECTAVVGTPAAVVASFYDVRYGGQALDERRTLELSQQIGRLEEFCTQQPRAGQ